MNRDVAQTPDQYPQGDIDTDGKLALGLFVGVILVLLAVIYALAQAA